MPPGIAKPTEMQLQLADPNERSDSRVHHRTVTKRMRRQQAARSSDDTLGGPHEVIVVTQ
jgi:hypothetical protein